MGPWHFRCWGSPSLAHLRINTAFISRGPAGSALRGRPTRGWVCSAGVAVTLTYLRCSHHHFVTALEGDVFFFSCRLWLGVYVHVHACVHVRVCFHAEV